jgi:Ca2+-transporting ATPase
MVAIYQDKDAESALEALKNMQANKCQVRRNGEWVTEESENLVPGDIVQVRMGDNIPADIRLIELVSASLQVEEAALTGEPESISKVTDAVQGNVLQD